MEMFRNMEVVLMLCFGLICAAALLAQPTAAPGPEAVSVEAGKIPVVVVTGKRLSAQEKAQGGQDAG
jgi:hypothetical protein